MARSLQRRISEDVFLGLLPALPHTHSIILHHQSMCPWAGRQAGCGGEKQFLRFPAGEDLAAKTVEENVLLYFVYVKK